ncbi:MAG: TorF family putative porin, partial [Helicobacteraceae bacterium]|nr:TorF family putative porin [Helicobacteraceae bacterium]
MTSRFIFAFLLTIVSCFAAGFSGGAEYKSDYLFRGVTQSNHAHALQGRARYGFNNGFYLGAFASNIYDPKEDTHNAIEYDFSLGLLGGVKDVWFEAGAISYNYNIEYSDFLELLFVVGYGGFRLAVYTTVSSDNSDALGDRYLETSLDLADVMDLVDIGFGAGYAIPNDQDANKPLNLYASISKTFSSKTSVGVRSELYSRNAKDFDKARYFIFAK